MRLVVFQTYIWVHLKSSLSATKMSSPIQVLPTSIVIDCRGLNARLELVLAFVESPTCMFSLRIRPAKIRSDLNLTCIPLAASWGYWMTAEASAGVTAATSCDMLTVAEIEPRSYSGFVHTRKWSINCRVGKVSGWVACMVC